MNILLTGAFGNIGRSTLDALLAAGHTVRTFDRLTRANQQTAGRYRGRIDPAWGDLRSRPDVQRAVRTAYPLDAAIHLGFVIPRLSATGVNSEDRPEFARAVNLGGTANLLQALDSLQPKPRFIFASSLHIYGRTQHLAPPRTAADPPNPVEVYAAHKVEAEQMVRRSGLAWAILRIGAALPIRLILDPGMYEVPLDNRIEFIHTRDAGQAFANAAACQAALGRVLLLGGGASCQMVYREMMTGILETVGIGPLPEGCFTRVPYSVDWLDTRESQALLAYQQRTFADYLRDLRRALGPLRLAVLLLRPLLRRWLIARSPYSAGPPPRKIRPAKARI